MYQDLLLTTWIPSLARVAGNQGDHNGGITPAENGRRFLTPFACAGCLVTV